MNRAIEKVIQPSEFHMVGDGFRVHSFFPSQEIDSSRMSPFVLFDYNQKFHFSQTMVERWVGPHPHRGFETVTIAFEWSVSHHDSSGHSGTIYPGDVQWMTAGSGVLHKEYHEKKFSEKGVIFQMTQIWVNLPKKDKMSQPKYQAITWEQRWIYKLENKSGEVQVIAGEYKWTKWPASTFSPIEMYDIKLNEWWKVDLFFPKNHNVCLLILDGEIQIENEKIKEDSFVLFSNNAEDIVIEGVKKSTILVLAWEPIGEPMVHYGPFVMNEESEIREAMDDFRRGKFGELEN